MWKKCRGITNTFVELLEKLLGENFVGFSAVSVELGLFWDVRIGILGMMLSLLQLVRSFVVSIWDTRKDEG